MCSTLSDEIFRTSYYGMSILIFHTSTCTLLPSESVERCWVPAIIMYMIMVVGQSVQSGDAFTHLGGGGYRWTATICTIHYIALPNYSKSACNMAD